MVLSNKKLKQKLREQLSKSLVSSVSNPSSSSIASPSSTTPQSLSQLLGAAAHKPRLSKRESRRMKAPLDTTSDSATQPKDEEAKSTKSTKLSPVDGGGEGVRVQNGMKKRKRDEGDVKEGADSNKEEKKTRKKNKKKKARKNAKKDNQKKVEPAQISEIVSVTSNGDQFDAHKIEIDDRQGNEQVSKKVYVGGIPYYSTEDDIRSFFDHCGTITEVDCMKFPETGKFRGIAILDFKTEEAAKRAMALDGADMGGFFLKIQRYNKTTQVEKTPAFSPPVIQGYNRIYAGNLSWDITEDDLKNLFSDCSVSSIRFGEDKETGEFKGYAHVDFSDSTSLAKALEKDQKVVCGRPVRITCAVALRNAKPRQSTYKDTTVNKSTTEGAVHQSTTEGTVRRSTTGGAVGQSTNEGTVGQSNSQVAAGQFTTKVVDQFTAEAAATKVAVDQFTTEAVADSKPGVSVGKMRRRNCYLCGERGHISSACPKQVAQEANPSTG